MRVDAQPKLAREHAGRLCARAREEIKNICCRNVLEYLDIKTQPSAGYPELKFKVVFEKSEGDLHPMILYEYLMENKSIKDYTDKLFY